MEFSHFYLNLAIFLSPSPLRRTVAPGGSKAEILPESASLEGGMPVTAHLLGVLEESFMIS